MDSFVCSSIEDVSIDNNYGGKLYDLKIDANFNSATSFQVSFVSEDGEYDITDTSLSAEIPSVLSIGAERTFNVFPTMWKKQKSPSGSLLVVSYLDASMVFLDKMNVVYDTRNKKSPSQALTNDRFLSILPVNGTIVATSDDDLMSGKCTPAKLIEEMLLKSIPVSTKVKNFLEQFDLQLIDNESSKSIAPIFIETVGTLRDTLNALGAELGVVFYWDWTIGGNGQLDYYDATIKANSQNLANSIKQQFAPFITNHDESCSIQDQVANVDFIYDLNSNELGRSGFVNYYMWDITKNPDAWKNTYGKNVDFTTRNGRELCAAAMISKSFFARYVIYHMALYAAENARWLDIQKKDGTGNENMASFNSQSWTGHFLSSDDEYITHNPAVVQMFRNFDFGLVYYHISSVSFATAIQTLQVNNLYSRASIVSEISRIKDTQAKIKELMESGFWVLDVRANGNSASPVNSDSAESGASRVQQKAGLTEADIERAYKTCLAFASNVNRWYFSREKSRKHVQYYGWSTQDWVREFSFAGDSVMKEVFDAVLSYKDNNRPKESNGSDEEGTEVKTSSKYFKETLKIAEGAPNTSTDDDGSCDEEGYLFFDFDPNRVKRIQEAISDDLIVYDKEVSHKDYSSVSVQDQGYTRFFVARESDAITALRRASLIRDFGLKPREGQTFSEAYADQKVRKKSKTYSVKEGDAEDWDWRVLVQDQKNSFAVANKFSQMEIPQVKQQAGSVVDDGKCEEDETTSPSEEDFVVEYSYDMDRWIQTVSQYKMQAIEPSKNWTFEIKGIIVPQVTWGQNGLEAYSVSYGTDGTSTTLSVGTRKKQNQSLDNQERLMKVYKGQLGEVRSSRPSSKRFSMNYGLRLFS